MRAAHQLNAILPESDDVVVIPDESLDAYALPAARGRIIVTSGPARHL